MCTVLWISIRTQIIPQIVQNVHQLENRILLLLSQLCQFTLFYLSHQCHRYINFQYFGQ
jgi:hypothetical protein